MKVNIEIAGLPLYKTFGKSKKIEFEFHGETLKELMDALVRKFGFEVRKFLLDKTEISIRTFGCFLTEQPISLKTACGHL